jgi:hypothetical protein
VVGPSGGAARLPATARCHPSSSSITAGDRTPPPTAEPPSPAFSTSTGRTGCCSLELVNRRAVVRPTARRLALDVKTGRDAIRCRRLPGGGTARSGSQRRA